MSATTGIVAAVFARFSDTLELSPLEGQVGVFGLGLEPILVFTCFSLSIMFAIRAVIVWHSVKFDQDIKALNQRITGGETRAELLVNLSNDLDRCVVANEKTIGTVKNDLWWSGVFCFAQIIAWLLWLS
ncbi:hypothetical protein A8B78_21535 [Jannaschia sp. EhC01]|nr:hypothetical protein A8B78_21535 [Jannaschia sp. EhC01]